MAEYLHGAYGNLADSVIESPVAVSTVPVYFGTAPVNLVRGYADKDVVNVPVRLDSLSDARRKVGDSADWSAYTLCEAVAVHYGSGSEGVGPIYAVNVLDPGRHRAKKESSEVVPVHNGTAALASDRLILDTLKVSPAEGEGEAWTEGADYTVAYNWETGQVILTAVEGGAMEAAASAKLQWYDVDPSMVAAADVIGRVDDDGALYGMAALDLLYQEQFAVPNLLAAPGWSEQPDVYAAMVKAAAKINGHWDAFVLADIPLTDGKAAVDTVDKAIAWKDAHAYNSERSAVCWPQVADAQGRALHLSTLYAATALATDGANEGVPFESVSNKAIPAVRQHFGEGSPNRGYDQRKGNKLNEHGITTAIGWAGEWVLWGPHTAAYAFGAKGFDSRAVFASTMRMLFHLTNGFQQEWAGVIDKPMTRALQDRIVNREQARLDGYVSQGALIGSPRVEFVAASNPDESVVQGDFRWDLAATPIPPLKSATVHVAYTDEGFSSYFDEEAML